MTETEHRPVEVGDPTASIDFDKTPPPSRFKLRAQLLDAGSESRVLGETDNLQLKIRVYAAHEGENAMHAHHNQDHSFIVLQGQARFYGPRGEAWDLTRNEGIWLPEGTYYCFENSGEEPLVVLRIAAMMRDKGDPEMRLGVHQQQIDAHTPENRRPEKIVYREGEFYE
ncbi:MAG: cupin domain-containing protein [Alphaproteobacteria bacterium]|nr:cupin domain-containing protein [Alphaproteobacteria bacterium]